MSAVDPSRQRADWWWSVYPKSRRRCGIAPPPSPHPIHVRFLRCCGPCQAAPSTLGGWVHRGRELRIHCFADDLSVDALSQKQPSTDPASSGPLGRSTPSAFGGQPVEDFLRQTADFDPLRTPRTHPTPSIACPQLENADIYFGGKSQAATNFDTPTAGRPSGSKDQSPEPALATDRRALPGAALESSYLVS